MERECASALGKHITRCGGGEEREEMRKHFYSLGIILVWAYDGSGAFLRELMNFQRLCRLLDWSASPKPGVSD